MEDSRIIELYWEREEQAIHAAASKYGSYCYAIAYNILGSREDAVRASTMPILAHGMPCRRTGRTV